MADAIVNVAKTSTELAAATPASCVIQNKGDWPINVVAGGGTPTNESGTNLGIVVNPGQTLAYPIANETLPVGAINGIIREADAPAGAVVPCHVYST